MGAKLTKEEQVNLEKLLKEGKISKINRGVCKSCAAPLREMRFRGKPLCHCRCGYQWGQAGN